MSKEFDSIQHAGNIQLNALTTNLPPFGAVLQTIVAEGTDYTKKAMDKRTAFVEKLLGAKSLDTMIQIHPNMPRRRTPTSPRRRQKWANSIPTSPRHASNRLN